MIHTMHRGRIRITHSNQARYGLKFRVPPHLYVYLNPFTHLMVTAPCSAPLRTYRAKRRTYRRA